MSDEDLSRQAEVGARIAAGAAIAIAVGAAIVIAAVWITCNFEDIVWSIENIAWGKMPVTATDPYENAICIDPPTVPVDPYAAAGISRPYPGADDLEYTAHGVKNAYAEVDWTDASEGCIRIRSFEGPSNPLRVRFHSLDGVPDADAIIYDLDPDGEWTEIEPVSSRYRITVYDEDLSVDVLSTPATVGVEYTTHSVKSAYGEVDWTYASEGRIRIRSFEGPSNPLAVKFYSRDDHPDADEIIYDLDPNGEWTEVELDSGLYSVTLCEGQPLTSVSIMAVVAVPQDGQTVD